MGERKLKKGGDVYSKSVRAGERTYFFDVKHTRGDDYYVRVTESKRRIDSKGKFVYDKHKLFIYKEDFEKFANGLEDVFAFIRSEKGNNYGIVEQEHRTSLEDEIPDASPERKDSATNLNDSYSSDISFDDLEDEDPIL